MDTHRLGFSNTGGSASRLGDRLRVALVVSGFPTREDPRRGIFNMRAQQALASVADVTVLFLRAWTPGRHRGWRRGFAEANVITITTPQLPVGRFLRSRLGLAANIRLYRLLGWRAVRKTILSSDIVHSVDASVGMVVSDWASKAGKRHVTQVIGSDVNTIIPRLPSFAVQGWEKWLHGAVCNSTDLAKRFAALYPGVPNVRTIPRGVDPRVFAPAGPVLGPQAHDAPVRFGFFGGFRQQALSPHFVKGGPTLLAAWKNAEEKLAKTGSSLLLAGPDCRSDVVSRWHRGLRHPNRVHVVGELLPADMPGYLRAVDVVLVPSFAEGLPNVCLEASACSRAVFGSAVGGVPEVIVHGETGVILPPGDATAWASALVSYSSQSDQLRKMGWCARATVQRLFDSRDYGKRLVSLYEEALRIPLIGGVPA
jgi:L-malate glycosyltransferase